MTIYINARLDCSHPYITINNKKTGDVLAYFTSQEVDNLFLDGDVTLEDLSSNDTIVQHELIKTLFLAKTITNFKQQLDQLPRAFKYRKSTYSFSRMKPYPPFNPYTSSPSLSTFLRL